MLCRISTTGGEKGSPDTVRDVRGFSVKFYTEEGNHDIVGNHVVCRKTESLFMEKESDGDFNSLFSSSGILSSSPR